VAKLAANEAIVARIVVLREDNDSDDRLFEVSRIRIVYDAVVMALRPA
jgi:hypothetical protein